MSAPSKQPLPGAAGMTGPAGATASAVAAGAAAPAGPVSAGPAPEGRRSPAGRLTFLTTLLVVITAVPLAASVVPNTVPYIVPLVLRDLGGTTQTSELLRMAGLALPALMLAVPVAVVPARRVPAWTLVLGGLLITSAGELLAAFADSTQMIGAVRLIEGLGAGTVLPATVVLVWEQRRRRALGALWAGVFVASFTLAMPVALGAVPRVLDEDWQVVLRPVPLLVGLGLGAVVLHAGAWLVERRPAGGPGPLPVMRRGERTQLLLPLVPACGFAFLTVATTYGWSPGAQLIVAALGGAGLLGLAIVGSRGTATGSPLACAVVVLTVGMVGLPAVAPLTGLLSTIDGTGGVSMLPFLVGAALAVVGALAMVGAGRDAALGGLLGGHGVAVVAVLVLLTVEPASRGWALTAGVGLLGLGLGAALAASLRNVTVGSALFAVSMCFPAVLTGHLVVGSLQLAKVNEALAEGTGEAGVIAALTTAFRTWLVIAGVIVVVMAAVAAMVSRRRRREPRVPAQRDGVVGNGSGPAAGDPPGDAVPAADASETGTSGALSPAETRPSASVPRQGAPAVRPSAPAQRSAPAADQDGPGISAAGGGEPGTTA